MRHALLRATVIATLAIGASRAFSFPTGSVATRTDARGFFNKPKEPNCTLCHTPAADGTPSGINDPSGSLRILDVPANYVPGTVYTLTLQLQHAWDPMPVNPLRWGFEIQAIQANTGDSSGTWILNPNVPPDSFRVMKAGGTTVYKNRRYITHAGWLIQNEHPGGPTHYGEVGPVEWHLKWQAPAGDSGKVYFFASGNSTNGDDLCTASGDYVFTTAESTVAGGVTGVPGAGRAGLTALDLPRPNPMSRATQLAFALAKGGAVDLGVFDLTGRKVKTLVHEFREAGPYAEIWSGGDDNGERCRNGVYFVRLTAPDRQVITRKVVLSR